MRVLWGAAALLLTTGAGAQAPVTPPAPAWAMSADLGFNAARGNTTFTLLTSSFRVTHVNKQHFELDWSSLITYGENNVAVIARRLSTGLKVDYRPTATWSPFVFATAERDVIRRLDLFTNAGAGVKWTYFRDTQGAASLSVAAIHSYKSIFNPGPTEAPHTTTARISLRPKLLQKYASGWSIEETSFYQPAFSDPADFMVDANTRIGYAINKTASVFTQHIYRADSRPQVGVKREDQLLVIGVKLTR